MTIKFTRNTVVNSKLYFAGDIYSLDSVTEYNQISAGAASVWPPQVSSPLKLINFNPPGLGNVQQVMASPPTVAISTTNPLASGNQISPYQNSLDSVTGAGTVDLSFVSCTRGGNPLPKGTTSPDYNFVKFDHISAVAGGTAYSGGNAMQFGVMHYGSSIVLVVKGLTNSIFAKVNDQYVSLTPTAVPNNATLNYYSLTFGGAALRRIDFIMDNVLGSCAFGGFFINPTDMLMPAPVRGPRVIIMGDSFTTATGAGGTALGFTGVFSEYMGWDDVWPSGIGGTGLLNAGSYCTYQQRVMNDVIPFNPDEVIICGFYNDTGSASPALQNALTTLIQTIRTNLPNCIVKVVGPYVNKGSGNQGISGGISGQRIQSVAAVASFNSVFVRYIDTSTGYTPTTPQTLTLSNSVSANATTFLTTNIGFVAPGTTYQFPDGSRSYVISRSGYTATVDKVVSAWPAGTVITQVGNCYLTGSGFSGATTGQGNADVLVYTDGVHPSPAGHIALGVNLAQKYVASMSTWAALTQGTLT